MNTLHCFDSLILGYAYGYTYIILILMLRLYLYYTYTYITALLMLEQLREARQLKRKLMRVLQAEEFDPEDPEFTEILKSNDPPSEINAGQAFDGKLISKNDFTLSVTLRLRNGSMARLYFLFNRGPGAF